MQNNKCSCSMSIVSGIVNNLEMISGLWEGMCGLYASRTLFSIKVLSAPWWWVFLVLIPGDTEAQLY